ncbi:LADA_0G04742g1_1 [Lachancea dasiensis]|uniref:Actin cytoskeleton-regulatory complex protein SLA1 n=1 Tax=Lachancea dasiensis TaxID=1072105 RepID=A0A1G4JSB0_9SACH|nr:LADA_0G04742g1_1 [Lachancea dasiensis]
MTLFLGIYKAIYQYEPQSEEELALEEDDLLYLLQKSDIDDWWSVKKRVIGSDAEEPVGLVPNNYIEPAGVTSTAKALFDYPEVQNADEEIAFNENDIFDIYDSRDPDWILCRLQRTGECGFVPGNYIEEMSGIASAGAGIGAGAATVPAAIPVAPQTSTVNASSFPPPPQHVTKTSQAVPPAISTPSFDQDNEDLDYASADEDDVAAPPKPTRPLADEPKNHSSTIDHYQNVTSEATNQEPSQESTRFQTWEISEVVGRKKHKAKFAIGRNTIFFTPSKGTPQQWPIDDLMTYDNEKKHIFFEFSNPYVNLEIHTGSTSVANEIMAVLGELKGAYHASGLREVEAASKASTKTSQTKQGKVVYDFIGESGDELTVKEGQVVHILDDKRSQDWWMCELPETGRKGVVPAQFIEPINQLSYMASSLKDLTKSNQKTSSKNWKDDSDQTVSKKSSARKRASSILHGNKKKDSSKKKEEDGKKQKEYPDSKKTRVWVDRSGTFKVEAEFIGCVEGKIHLHKANGVKIAVAADKLCTEDLERVEQMTGTSLDKYKPKSTSVSSSSARDKERERRRKVKEHEDRERERAQRDSDRLLRERELDELRRARDLLDKERELLRAAQERDLPPIQPPRPSATPEQTSAKPAAKSVPKPVEYDWFEFFLNCGVDVSNCQRYTINFEREQISEESLPDIQPSILRTLGLREGDIIRVVKYLNQKFGRETTQLPTATGGLFSEPDGSLKVSHTGKTGGLSENLLPQQAGPSVGQDDDAWTVKPAATTEAAMPPRRSEFTGSMQDLLDLQPLEPKKAPQPNFKDLEAIKTGSSRAESNLAPDKTGTSMAPLDPFKTGGHNLLPVATGGFVMVPVSTGGLLPFQRTGGLPFPQTTFGMQPTGTILPVQKTGSGLMPVNTGGLVPQTTFGLQGFSNPMPLQRTGNTIPAQQAQYSGAMMGLQSTGGPISMPQTSFGMQATGATPFSTNGNVMPLQRTGGNAPFGLGSGGFQSAPPQTSFGVQSTGGYGATLQPGFSNHLTGGPAMMPQSTFGNQMTGGANIMPVNSFANQYTGSVNPAPQHPSTDPNSMFGNMGPHTTGGMGIMPQNSFNIQRTGGMHQLPPQPNQTANFQPQSQFGMHLQRTGGASLPPISFNTGGAMQQQQPLSNVLTGGVNQLNNMFQNSSISQPALQSQPTGFGFGNGPQPQQRQANLYNASTDNPFGF